MVRKIIDARWREAREATIIGTAMAVLLVVVWSLVVWNNLGSSAEEIKSCEIACAPYRGLELVYLDGECRCKNGYEVDARVFKVEE